MKLTPKEITEKKVWDEFLRKNESGHLFQSFDWGIFKETQGWKNRRIALIDSAEEIKAALSILEKKIPLTGLKIWYLPRGPVLDFQSRELVEEVVDFLIDFARKNKVMAVKISPDVILNENTKWILELLKNKGFKETDDYQLHKCTIRIDLSKYKSENEIFADLKKNTRWEIGRGKRDLVIVKEGKNENDLNDFYQLYSEAMGKDRLPYTYFKNFWETFKDNILILVAEHEKHKVSTAFIPFFNKKCWYLFGGLIKKYSIRYPSQVLQGEAIILAKNRGAETYDLQGIPCGEPKTPHDKGVLQFKEGFGGKRIELIGEFDYAFSPVLFKILYPIFRKLHQARIIIKGITGRV